MVGARGDICPHTGAGRREVAVEQAPETPGDRTDLVSSRPDGLVHSGTGDPGFSGRE